MKIVKVKDVKKQYLEKPLFTGKITRQTAVSDTEGSDINIDYIYFPKGVRNKFHTHSNDQILVVTKGEGFIATKKKKVKIKKGDIVWAPKNEAHWHGASEKSSFAHIAITKAKTKLTQIEE